MPALPSSLCVLMLLPRLLGSAHCQMLQRGHPGTPAAPNSSGVPVASLQWSSVKAPFLLAVWTLVALSSLLGELTWGPFQVLARCRVWGLSSHEVRVHALGFMCTEAVCFIGVCAWG